MTPVFDFQPFRASLYSAEELLDGFDPVKPSTYAQMRDLLIYQEYIRGGGAAVTDYLTAMSRALHDNGITQLLADELGGKSSVALMGGHSAKRNDPAYVAAAQLASRLAKAGMTVLSGGGPGAMEAAHLGAMFPGGTGLDAALAFMAKGPLAIPDKAQTVIRPDFSIDPAMATQLGQFLAPAVQLLRDAGGRGAGVGVPTWLYGQEPFTPLAGPIAKYFQNSIREDGLLAIATHGIIYVQGGPGTIQEVFQDAAQNFYHSFPAGSATSGYFSPMVFFGDFWTATMKVQPVFEALFLKPPAGATNAHWDEYRKYVLFTQDLDEAAAFITAFQPPTPNLTLEALRAGS